MQYEILPRITDPRDLEGLSDAQLETLAAEIRERLCSIVADRAAHFASNLGVVELAIALHRTFDFKTDRLIWDTGHQIYPHKLLTGRFPQFDTLRERGGLMGYPNPEESDYDLFVTGHAGASVSTSLGLKAGDDLVHPTENRKSVAVIGDGALPSGVVFEAFNNAAGLQKDLLVILNDNKMGICPRVGGLASYLDAARTAPFYDGLKKDVAWLLNKIPVVGEQSHKLIAQGKDALKHFLHGGMLFEELGFRYVGPVDGHDLKGLRETLERVKHVRGPVLLHVLTEKGHGFKPAAADPVTFHTPAPFQRDETGQSVAEIRKSGTKAYTDHAAAAIHDALANDKSVAVLTAAMCQGNKLETVRTDFPDRFFDTGICEGHAVAFAGGMAKAGARPIVDIYSTFLQRSFDHVFQEVALQNLPVTFLMDRAGLCGPDGATHHGVFDHSYMRVFPNMTVMAPGDAGEIAAMLQFSLKHSGPCSLRYPKAAAVTVRRDAPPIEHGRAEVYADGPDGLLIGCGVMFPEAVAAAAKLREEEGLEVGVVNPRFVKPIDVETLGPLVEEAPWVVTAEENVVTGGFGSALLEALNAAGVRTHHVRVLALPDEFIEHGPREEILADYDLDAAGMTEAALAMSERTAATV